MRGFAGLNVLLTASAAPMATLATRLRMPSDFCWDWRDSRRPGAGEKKGQQNTIRHNGHLRPQEEMTITYLLQDPPQSDD